jgi:hypothetical protein
MPAVGLRLAVCCQPDDTQVLDPDVGPCHDVATPRLSWPAVTSSLLVTWNDISLLILLCPPGAYILKKPPPPGGGINLLKKQAMVIKHVSEVTAFGSKHLSEARLCSSAA